MGQRIILGLWGVGIGSAKSLQKTATGSRVCRGHVGRGHDRTGHHIRFQEASLQQKWGSHLDSYPLPCLFMQAWAAKLSSPSPTPHPHFLQPALRKDPDSACEPWFLSSEEICLPIRRLNPLNSLPPAIQLCPFEPILKTLQYATNFRHLQRMAGPLTSGPSKNLLALKTQGSQEGSSFCKDIRTIYLSTNDWIIIISNT